MKAFRHARATEDRGRCWATSQGAKQLFTSVSTMGISDSDEVRDVPLLLNLIYQYALHVSHLDNRVAEVLLIEDEGRHVRDCAIDRPTLLTGAAPAGAGKLRVWVRV